MNTTPVDIQTGLLDRSITLARDIKLSHSVFALPFALLGLFMAAWPSPPLASISTRHLIISILLVIAAMVFARTAAMLANRWLDQDIDGRNPRTAGRALPSGTTDSRTVLSGLIISAGLFMTTCLLFLLLLGNWWPLILGVPVISWLCLYPLLKRMTWGCHIWLGASLAMSPLAAAIAVQPETLLHQPALWLLAVMVLCWVAGFDVIYALQDVDIDRQEGLHSIPGTFGVAGALLFSRVLHLIAGICLILAWMTDQRLGGVFLGASIAACLLLVFEHATVRRWGTSRMALTFFTINGVVACILGAAGILDLAI